MSQLIIRNGEFLTPDGDRKSNGATLIQDGAIKDLNHALDKTDEDAQIIDSAGMLILPGLTDINALLQEPGSSRNGTIFSETKAAAAGGVTTLCCRPDTLPANDSKAVTKLIMEQVEAKAACNVLPLGALTQNLAGEHLANYASLKEAGCIGLSNAFNPLHSLLITKRCFQYARTHNMKVFLNPIEASLHEGKMHEGRISTTIGLQGVPAEAESIAVAQLLSLAKVTKVSLHISQLSSADSVALIRQAKTEGTPVTCDVSIANLVFTDEAVMGFDSLYHCMPPLRSELDRKALIEGIKDHTIDAISSGHCPLEAAEKLKPFGQTKPGMATIELLLPLALNLEKSGDLPFNDFIRAMTVGPQKILGMSYSSLAPAEVADLVIFDPQKNTKVSADRLYTRGHNSPFLNQELPGQVFKTICKGKITFAASE